MAQPTDSIEIPKDKYIEVLRRQITVGRETLDQQEAVILGLLDEKVALIAERDELSEALRKIWVEQEAQNASADSG